MEVLHDAPHVAGFGIVENLCSVNVIIIAVWVVWHEFYDVVLRVVALCEQEKFFGCIIKRINSKLCEHVHTKCQKMCVDSTIFYASTYTLHHIYFNNL